MPPRLVLLEYRGAGTEAGSSGDGVTFDTALIGKGITFDTGGLNLKPTGFIEDMHMDMGGAAAVLGAMEGVAQAKLPLNVLCAVALAENAIGKDAVKPNAIIHSLHGQSVEVGNTDGLPRLTRTDYHRPFFQFKLAILVARHHARFRQELDSVEAHLLVEIFGARVLIGIGVDPACFAVRAAFYGCGGDAPAFHVGLQLTELQPHQLPAILGGEPGGGDTTAQRG